MEKIIELNLEENKKINEKILELFSSLNNEIESFIDEEEVDDKFIDLYDRFININDKVKSRTWINAEKAKLFFKNFEYITNDDYLYNKYSFILEYIHSIDISNGKLLKNDSEFIYNFIRIISVYENLNFLKYKDIIDFISNKKFQEMFRNSDNKNFLMTKFIDGFLSKYSVNQIINEIENSEEGIASFDDIYSSIINMYNFYIQQATILFEFKLISVDTLNNIEKMLIINEYNSIAKKKYIDIVKYVNEYCEGILDTIEKISDLNEIFVYLRKKINFYDKNKLLDLFLLKNINKLSIEELLKDDSKFNNESRKKL